MTLFFTNKNYRLLFSASAVSNLGDGVSALALPWLASLITRDPMLIATVALPPVRRGSYAQFLLA